MGRLFPFLATLTGLATALFPAPAKATQDVVNAWQICDAQTSRQERIAGIPKNLLKAISMAETGRWNEARKATIAWPWTVMALGQGHFFPTRQAALDYIVELRDRGITNIDVGCMQINLFYHGDAFASVEQALDPKANAAYAASYLKGLYDSTRSWTQAAAFYHSRTPKRAKSYKLKVLKHWNVARQTTASIGKPSAITGTSAHIDYARMADLNRRLKVKLTSSTPADSAQLRRSQLAAWNAGGSKNFNLGQLADLRRVKLDSKRKRQFMGTNRNGTGEEFANKRRQQLDKWRVVGYTGGSG